MDKKDIKVICLTVIETAYTKAFNNTIPWRTNGDALGHIKETIENSADSIVKQLNKVDLNILKIFLKEPQIYDILVDGLQATFLYTAYGERNRKFTLPDDCTNYCLAVIDKYYGQLSNNESLSEIKKFLNTLLTENKLVEILLQEESAVNLIDRKHRFFIYNLTKDSEKYIKNLYKQSEKRVESKLTTEFVVENKNFVSIKNQYQDIMKQIHQMGFIYFVGQFKFNEFYIPPVLLGESSFIRRNYTSHLYYNEIKSVYQNGRQNWKNIFYDSNIVYVIGGAGYGKSLFLRNVINNYTELNIESVKDYLLIYCDLKTFYSNGNANKKSVIDFLGESMVNITGASNITKEFIEYYLKRGRCIVLLDALDEVPKDVRSELHKKVIGYFSTTNSNNKICITSRDRGFIPEERIEVFHINPLSNYDIEAYLDKMIALEKFKKEEKEIFLNQAKILIEKRFLNNFLILSLLVNIYKAEKELPENKIDLYKKCFDYIAKKREEEKSKTEYNWNRIYPLMKDSTFISLSTLAAPNNTDIKREDVEELLKKQYKVKYLDEASAEYAIKEFLEFCSNRTELFVPSSVDDKFKFFHRSFFEYFYSRYIHQQSSVEKMYDLMNVFDIDSEVFELTVALVKEDNEMKYQELIDFIFSQVEKDFNSRHPNFIAFGILILVMQVVDDLYYIEKFFNIVITYYDLMKNGKVLSMNQRLLLIWLTNSIEISEDKKNIFRKTYESDCIIYFLDKLAVMTKYNKFIDNTKIEKDMILASESIIPLKSEIILQNKVGRNGISVNVVPFFFLVYQKYFQLEKVLSEFNKKTFAEWVNEQVGLTKKQRNNLKRGFTNYGALESQEFDRLLTALLR